MRDKHVHTAECDHDPVIEEGARGVREYLKAPKPPEPIPLDLALRQRAQKPPVRLLGQTKRQGMTRIAEIDGDGVVTLTTTAPKVGGGFHVFQNTIPDDEGRPALVYAFLRSKAR